MSFTALLSRYAGEAEPTFTPFTATAGTAAIFDSTHSRRERERQCVRVDLAYNVVCVQFVLERERENGCVRFCEIT